MNLLTSRFCSGWIEAQDFHFNIASDDDSIPKDSKLLRWHELLNEGMTKAGYNLLQSAAETKSFFQEAGFVNVTVVNFKMPIGAGECSPVRAN